MADKNHQLVDHLQQVDFLQKDAPLHIVIIQQEHSIQRTNVICSAQTINFSVFPLQPTVRLWPVSSSSL